MDTVAKLGRRRTRAAARALGLALTLAWAAGAALAQYKVVGPDGRVTYTDRPPAGAPPRPGAALAAEAAPSDLAALPWELRQAAARHPVTLHAMPDCRACDEGRALLRQRGIPHTEFMIATAEDADELRRREGRADLPMLRLGAQRLLGFESGEWHAMLDAAGYPRSSRLPPGYRAPVPRALAARAPDAASAPASPAPRPAAPALPSPSAGGFRF